MCRAELGLHVFHRGPFRAVLLQPTFRFLLGRTDKLSLNLQETTPFRDQLVEVRGCYYSLSISGCTSSIRCYLYASVITSLFFLPLPLVQAANEIWLTIHSCVSLQMMLMGSIIVVHASGSHDTIYHPTCDSTFLYFMAAHMVHYPPAGMGLVVLNRNIRICPVQFIQGLHTIHNMIAPMTVHGMSTFDLETIPDGFK
jgi:hypothetical protein